MRAELRLVAGAGALRAPQELEGVAGRERVGEIPEVDERHELLGRHVGEQLPQRLAGALGGQVPEGVDHGADGHVHDALLRAEPAQLRVVHEPPPGRTHIGQGRVER
jgi:hypothetical protein